MKRYSEPFEPEFLNPKFNIVEANKYINSVINSEKVHPVACLNYVCKYCCPHFDLYPDNTYCKCTDCPIGCLHAKMTDTRKQNKKHNTTNP